MRKGHFINSALSVALFGCVSALVVGCGGGNGSEPSDSSNESTGGVTGSTGGSGAGTAKTGGAGNTATSTGGRSTGAGGTTPGAGGTTPGAGGTSPGAGGTSPGAGGTSPGAGGTSPGAGGTTTTGGAATNDCQGVNDTGNGDTDCTSYGADYVCDRSDSTRDPRVCTCTDDGAGNLAWVCEHQNAGTAGAGNIGAGGATGAAGAGATLDCQQANDTGRNTDCTDFGADYVCDRTDSTRDPRVCTCTDDGAGNLAWVCEHQNAGVAGAGNTGTGGATGVAGAGSATLDCQRVNDTGGNTDCTDFGADYVCDRTDSTRDPRVCTCTDDGAGTLSWVCDHQNAGTAGTGG